MYKRENVIFTAEDQDLLKDLFAVFDAEEERERQEKEKEQECEKLIKKARKNRNLIVPPESAYESLSALEEWVRKNTTKYDTLILISKFWDKIGHFKKFIDMWIYIDELGVLEVWKVTKNSAYVFKPPKSTFSAKNQGREAANIYSSWRKRKKVPFELPAEAKEMLNQRAKPVRKKIAFIVPDCITGARAQAEYMSKFGESGDVFIWQIENIKNIEPFEISINEKQCCIGDRFDIYWLVKLLKDERDITVIVTEKGYINSMEFQERRISDFNTKSKTPDWSNEDYCKFSDRFY